MKPAANNARRTCRLHVALAAAGMALIAGCGEGTTGIRVPNRPPHIRITAGPSGDSLHIYRPTFRWAGEDSDGRVVGYEYALDDTTAVDSVVATGETSITLVFSADDFRDTVIETHDGRPVELSRFGRHHTFCVRAEDNEGAWSAFAFAAFFAITVAPTTQILNPYPGGIPTLGTRFEVTWAGEDLDGRGPPRLFATRIVPVPAESLLAIPFSRLDVAGAGPPWSPFTEGTLGRFAVDEGSYLFGIRAMDEAGAVEPTLREAQNVFRFRARPTPGLPTVMLTGPGKSVRLPSADEEAKTFDLTSGRAVTFTWSADASAYGGRISDYAYGIDLESVEPDDPGWIPVANPLVTVRLQNPAGVEETEHIFLLRIGDTLGQTLVVDAILRVGPPDFDREILYIDDWGGDAAGTPPDADHDRFIREVLLAEADRRGFRVDEVEFTNPNGTPVSGTPDLALLRRYRLLVWNVSGSNVGLMRAVDPESGLPLHEYLTLGGNLWLMGQEVFTRSVAWAPVPEFFGFNSGDLAYEFLHIRTRRLGSQIEAGGFLRPRGNLADQRIDGMDGANPTAEAAAEGWPPLLVTKEPYTSPLRGIPRIEGMTIGYVQEPDQGGDLDTLYTYVTNGSRIEPIPVASRLDDAPCAFRFGGLASHGRVLVFTFPVYWWSDGAADSLGQRAIEWFWAEEPRRHAAGGAPLNPARRAKGVR